MSNGDEYYSQSNHGGNYSNTYSLWGNSKYYDINNLSPQNYFANANSSKQNDEYQTSTFDFEQWTDGGPATEDHDIRNRRIIKKEAFFEDPDNFYKNDDEPSTSPSELYWTDQFWQKEGEIWGGDMLMPKSCKQVLKKEAWAQEKLNKSMAIPVKMTKAESMMQKMGWQGGALGKSGEGIVEPIVPNLIYATKIGFGLYQPKQPSTSFTWQEKKEKKQNLNSMQVFDMNVLLHILEFVKNNTEVEVLFDKRLTRNERKRVHTLVNDVLNADDLALANYSSAGVMDLALQISDHNRFILVTQSEGEKQDRTLCLYKLPPSHVYLIIPDDLREETTDETTEDKPQVEPEEDTNPFLRSITRNLKNCNTDEETQCDETCKHDDKIVNKILEFFSEFANKTEFTVFRYVGPFSKEECHSFEIFLSVASKYLKGEKICEKYLNVFNKLHFEINADINGHTVIYKKMGTDGEF